MLFESPPMATGTEAHQISQVYSYLYQLSEQLNMAMSNLSLANFSTETAQALQSVVSGGEQQQKAQAEQANSLKALIIKTADIVRAEMDLLETTLRSEYVAQSEFGTYQESMQATITATAQGVVQSYGYSTELEALQAGMVDFETYQQDLNAYIKTGLLYFDDTGTPVYGVAVGQDFAKVVADGKEVLSRKGLMSTFTADRLSFWQDKTEIAYMTGGMLHIARAELTDQLVIGNYIIKRMQDDSLAILVNRSEA